jgi:hypothetical protein
MDEPVATSHKREALMSQLPSVLSAVAAAIAAILAGLNLYVSGRREHRKWIRDALIDAYVEYLGASFRGGGTGVLRRAFDRRLSAEEMENARLKLDESRTLQNQNLTRLRLIAPKDVVKAAEALHNADLKVWDAAFASLDPPSDTEWGRMRDAQRDARHRFIDEARRSPQSRTRDIDRRLYEQVSALHLTGPRTPAATASRKVAEQAHRSTVRWSRAANLSSSAGWV